MMTEHPMRTAPLLRWFRRTARDLPWRTWSAPRQRRVADLYAVWVSEIMLQQTQVATAIPYYDRWMRRFPTVRALAQASLDDVLKIWEGLGYYARARNLHRAAREMCALGPTNPSARRPSPLVAPSPAAARLRRATRGLGVPRTPASFEEWLAVPGVGPYTAAAIASIAHGERVPVFDGNVRRVLSRLAARDVTEPRPIPRVDPGDYNQALMELGQRICTPRSPRCDECPISPDCRARQRGEQERWPTRRERKAVPHHEVAVGLIRDGDRLFVRRRAEDGLLGGLWEFPGGKRERGESFERCLAREIREETGMRVEVGPHLVTVPHRYSHFSVELRTYHCRLRRGRGLLRRAGARRPTLPPGRAAPAARWVTLSQLDSLAMPVANRKIVEALKREGRAGIPAHHPPALSEPAAPSSRAQHGVTRGGRASRKAPRQGGPSTRRPLDGAGASLRADGGVARDSSDPIWSSDACSPGVLP